MTRHVGTRGGPRGDDELPALERELTGLSGVALVRAAHAAARAHREPPQPRRRPFATSRAPAPIQPDWTPHSALQGSTVPIPGHWADGTPIPDEDTPEEDR